MPKIQVFQSQERITLQTKPSTGPNLKEEKFPAQTPATGFSKLVSGVGLGSDN
jgi:hypothetical protein